MAYVRRMALDNQDIIMSNSLSCFLFLANSFRVSGSRQFDLCKLLQGHSAYWTRWSVLVFIPVLHLWRADCPLARLVNYSVFLTVYRLTPPGLGKKKKRFQFSRQSGEAIRMRSLLPNGFARSQDGSIHRKVEKIKVKVYLEV